MTDKPLISELWRISRDGAQDWWRRADKPALSVAVPFGIALLYFRSWAAAFSISVPIYIAVVAWQSRNEPFGGVAKLLLICLALWAVALFYWLELEGLRYRT